MKVLAGDVGVAWDDARGDLRLSYVHDGLARVSISGGGRPRLTLLLADSDTASTFWRVDTRAGRCSCAARISCAALRGAAPRWR